MVILEALHSFSRKLLVSACSSLLKLSFSEKKWYSDVDRPYCHTISRGTSERLSEVGSSVTVLVILVKTIVFFDKRKPFVAASVNETCPFQSGATSRKKIFALLSRILSVPAFLEFQLRSYLKWRGWQSG